MGKPARTDVIRCRPQICRLFRCCAICFEVFCILDISGATAIEYAMVASGIAVVIITAVSTLGQEVNSMFFQQIVAAMQ